jgi:hypothetical protein
MDTTEIIIAITIALIYPYFFHKLIDKVMGYDKVNDMCDNVKYSEGGFNESSEHKQCVASKKQQLDNMELKRHVTFLIVALLSILVSSMIRQKSTKVGVGMGGVFLLIIALCMYWSNYNETAKLVILGLSLVAVIYVSTKMYSVKSWTDIFSPEFGTKTT